jgi:hypothetical protein
MTESGYLLQEFGLSVGFKYHSTYETKNPMRAERIDSSLHARSWSFNRQGDQAMRQAILLLDVRPLQVLIEVLIAEVLGNPARVLRVRRRWAVSTSEARAKNAPRRYTARRRCLPRNRISSHAATAAHFEQH